MRPVGSRSSFSVPSNRRRPSSHSGVVVQPRSEFPVRVRHLLLGGVLLSCLAWLWPRAEAAFALHNLAVKKAEHVLCLVGPMGPGLLREDPPALAPLLRRRLIRSEPDERPFAACIPLAEGIPMGHRAYRAHQRTAREFAEYLGAPGDRVSASLADLEFHSRDLAQLASDAWPFVRGGYLRLVEPSRHAREATHPASIPKPGVGHGLPASQFHHRSTLALGDKVVGSFGSGANARTLVTEDAGVTWTSGGRALASEIMDRCLADSSGRAFSLSLTETGRQVVLSQGPEAPPQASVLSESKERVLSVSCDHSALVALLLQPKDTMGRSPLRLRLCPFRLPCRDLPGPEREIYYPADIARVEGDTVLSRTHGGLTRVTSSRDDGRSWSPWVVAFDAQSAELPEAAAPFRLLQVGERTLLFGPPVTSDGSYLLLASSDHGASFQTP